MSPKTTRKPWVPVGGYPANAYTPAAWGWYDGQTCIRRSTALTTASATTGNLLFTGWFSPEGANSILGHFTAIDSSTESAILINRVQANAPINRYAAKCGLNGTNGALFTTEEIYKNTGSPPNAAIYFCAFYMDLVAGTGTLAISNGSAWVSVVTGAIGAGELRNFSTVTSWALGQHLSASNSFWWGRLADFWYKSNITELDLNVPSVRNSLLVDPGTNGTGYGLGTPEIWFRGLAADMNALTNVSGGGGNFSSLEGCVADYNYTQSRAVFNGTTHKIDFAAVTGLTSPLMEFTLSFWTRFSTTTGRSLFSLYGGSGGAFAVNRVGTSGKIRLTATDSSNTNTLAAEDGGNTSAALSTGTTDASRHHVLIVGSIVGDYVLGYVDGVFAFYTAIAGVSDLADFGGCVGARVGTNGAGSTFFDGSIGDPWFADAALDTAIYMPAFFGAAIDGPMPASAPLITGYKGAVGGVTPKIWLGQGMLASQWNAGKNLGTGGAASTVSGTFTLGA